MVHFLQYHFSIPLSFERLLCFSQVSYSVTNFSLFLFLHHPLFFNMISYTYCFLWKSSDFSICICSFFRIFILLLFHRCLLFKSFNYFHLCNFHNVVHKVSDLINGKEIFSVQSQINIFTGPKVKVRGI